LNTQVTAAQQALNQAEASFDAGLATNLERLVAQEQYLNAKLQLTSEIYNQRVYASDLARATGGLRPLLEQVIKNRALALSNNGASTTAPATGDLPSQD
jgi:outer membrane protein TolC